MRWSRLDNGMWKHRGLKACSGPARELYFFGRCYAGDNGTDGLVSTDDLDILCLALRLPTEVAGELVDAGLWLEHEDGFEIAGWLTENATEAERERISQARREAGRRGGHSTARHTHQPDDGEAFAEANGPAKNAAIATANARPFASKQTPKQLLHADEKWRPDAENAPNGNGTGLDGGEGGIDRYLNNGVGTVTPQSVSQVPRSYEASSTRADEDARVWAVMRAFPQWPQTKKNAELMGRVLYQDRFRALAWEEIARDVADYYEGIGQPIKAPVRLMERALDRRLETQVQPTVASTGSGGSDLMRRGQERQRSKVAGRLARIKSEEGEPNDEAHSDPKPVARA